MNKNRGTEWQNIFKNLCKEENIDCVRFYDTLQGFKNVDNPCDFVISKDKESPAILVECKSTHETSFGLDFRQLESLKELTNFKSIVLIWFVKKKKVCAITTDFVEALKKQGPKSYNPDKHFGEGCQIVEASFARIKPTKLDILSLWK